MDYTLTSIESVVYTWGTFGFLALIASSLAEGLSTRHSVLVSRGTNHAIPLPLIRLYVVMLSLYTIVIFYITMLMLCIGLYAMLSTVHLSFEATFRLDSYWLQKRWVRWILHYLDNMTDPGLVFAFMCMRLWKLHATVAVIAVSVAATHVAIFTTRRRMRSMNIDLSRPPPPTLLPRLFSETNAIVVAVMTTAYVMIICREVALLMKINTNA